VISVKPTRHTEWQANELGHVTLVVLAVLCALLIRSIPVWLWAVVYALAVFCAKTGWKEKTWKATSWLLLCVGCALITALGYGLGIILRLPEPWQALRFPFYATLALALFAFSGFV
jgi:hypothetical protein